MVKRLLCIVLCAAVIILLAFGIIYGKTMNIPNERFAFGLNEDAVIKTFAAQYQWDAEKYMAASWVGRDEETHYRKNGHQAEYYQDLYDYNRRYMEEKGLLPPKFFVPSQGGLDIAAVALNEVDQPDSAAMAGTNIVKYNDWYYGGRAYYASYQDECAWCCVFVCWCAEQCGYLEHDDKMLAKPNDMIAKGHYFAKVAYCDGMFAHLTSRMGYYYCHGSQAIPWGGSEYMPCIGDIFVFKGGKETSGGGFTSIYSQDLSDFSHIGIVTDVTDEYIQITQGNTASRVQSVNYTKADVSDPGTSGARLKNGCFIHVEYSNSYHAAGGFGAESVDPTRFITTLPAGIGSVPVSERGRVETMDIQVTRSSSFQVKVYLPNGYDSSSKPYNVLFMMAGGNDDSSAWMDKKRPDSNGICAKDILDYLFWEDGDAVPGFIAVSVPHIGPGSTKYGTQIKDQLSSMIRAINANYKTYGAAGEPEYLHTAILGFSSTTNAISALLQDSNYVDKANYWAAITPVCSYDSAIARGIAGRKNGNLGYFVIATETVGYEYTRGNYNIGRSWYEGVLQNTDGKVNTSNSAFVEISSPHAYENDAFNVMYGFSLQIFGNANRRGAKTASEDIRKLRTNYTTEIESISSNGMPSEMYSSCSNPGTRTTLSYTSSRYTKNLEVLLPAGYSASKKYNVLFLIPGKGGTEKSWFDDPVGETRDISGKTNTGQNVINNAIALGYCNPLIVVSFNPLNYANEKSVPDHRIADEIRNDIIPVLAEKYSIYAEKQNGIWSVDRDHFGVIGYSMGSIYVQSACMRYDLDLFSYFGGCSFGSPEASSIRGTIDSQQNAGYGINGFYMSYATNDVEGGESSAISSYREYLKSTKFSESTNSLLAPIQGAYNAGHSPGTWNIYLFNALRLFF